MQRGVQQTAAFAVALFGALSGFETARAEPVADLSVTYTADYMAGVVGDPGNADAFVDHLDLSATIDLGRFAGWRGATLFAYVINDSGGALNGDFATLQGVDNIEVTRQRARLYELWIEAPLATAMVKAGLYDLNSEFYVNDSAGLLIAPAFGIGSELAATGPNGPSIFPSTALALRIAAPLSEHDLVRFAVLNANAGVLGDPDGLDLSFHDGVLLVGEWSHEARTRINLGGWTYSEDQADIRDASHRARAAGLYATAERVLLNAGAAQETTAFVRLGASDGDTTPYNGGWQAGVLVQRAFAGRPESEISFGAYQGQLGDKFRANLRDDGIDAARAETGIEITYSDQLTRWLRVQPDLQLILDPGGDRDRPDLWVAGLRISITPFGH